MEYKKENLSQVNPQLYEWLTIVNDKSSIDSISQTREKSTHSGEKSSDKIHRSKKIAVDMNETERAEILRSSSITPLEIVLPEDFDLNVEQLERNMKSSVEKTLLKKLQDLGILTKYKTASVDVEFDLRLIKRF